MIYVDSYTVLYVDQRVFINTKITNSANFYTLDYMGREDMLSGNLRRQLLTLRARRALGVFSPALGLHLEAGGTQAATLA